MLWKRRSEAETSARYTKARYGRQAHKPPRAAIAAPSETPSSYKRSHPAGSLTSRLAPVIPLIPLPTYLCRRTRTPLFLASSSSCLLVLLTFYVNRRSEELNNTHCSNHGQIPRHNCVDLFRNLPDVLASYAPEKGLLICNYINNISKNQLLDISISLET